MPTNKHTPLASCLLALSITLTGCGSDDADEHLARAKSLQTSGDNPAQVIELKNALKLDPDHAEARLMLGLTYLDIGQFSSAVKELRKAKELGADPARTTLGLAEAEIRQGQFQEALDDLELAPADAPADEKAVLTAEAYIGIEKFAEGEALYQQVLEKNPEHAGALYGLAASALRQNKLEESQQRLDQLLKAHPDHERGNLVKGELLLRTSKDASAAEAFYDRASQSANPALAMTARLGKARSLFKSGDLEAALKLTNEVLEQAPNLPAANYIAGAIAMQQQRWKDSRDALQTVLKIVPEHPNSLLLLGIVQSELKQPAQAEELLRKYVALAPATVAGRTALATLLFQKGEPEEARDVLLPVREQGLKDRQYTSLLANTYGQLGDTENARRYLEITAQLAPGEARVTTQLAAVALAEGDREAAIAQLEQLAADETAPGTHDMLLIATRIQDRRYDEAIKLSEDLINKVPEEPAVHNLLGAAYMAQEKYDDAIIAFRKALEIDNTFSPARLNLARIAIKQGDREQAREILAAGLDAKPSAEILITLAQLSEQGSDRRKSLEYLELARANYPGNIASRLLLANYYVRARDLKNASALGRDLARLNDNKNIAVLSALAKIYALENDRGNAIKALTTAVELEPKFADAWMDLASLHMNDPRDYEKAEGFLKSASEHISEDSKWRVLLAQARLDALRGYSADALKRIDEIAAQYPDQVQAGILKGDILRKDGKLDAAIAAYQAVLAKEPNTATLLALANTYRDKGDEKKTGELMREWLEQHPTDERVRLALAALTQKEGDNDSALSEYEALVAKHPDNPVILNNLAWIYFERGDERFMDYAERALQAAPGSPEIMDTVGWFKVQADYIAQGLELLEKAVAARPGNREIQYHYAVALARSGENHKALQQLEKLLSSDVDFPQRENAEALMQSLK